MRGIVAALALLVAWPALAQAEGAPPTAWDRIQWYDVVMLVLAAVAVLLLLVADAVLPGSYRRHEGRDVKPQPWWSWLIAALLVLAATTVGHKLVSPEVIGRRGVSEVGDEAINMLGAYTAGVAASIGLLYVFAVAAPKSGLAFKWSDVVRGLAAFAVAAPILYVVSLLGTVFYELWTTKPAPELAHRTLRMISGHGDDPWSLALLALVIFAAPIVEEAMYRAFLQSAVARIFGPGWVAIILTSAVFAAAHGTAVPSDAPFAYATLFAVGLSCGVAFERTKRIAVPITMHACFNAAQTAMFLWTTT